MPLSTEKLNELYYEDEKSTEGSIETEVSKAIGQYLEEQGENEVGDFDAFMSGLVQGITFGFSDEISAGVESVFTGESYDDTVAEHREYLERAAENGWYAAGDTVGTVGSAIVPGGAALTGVKLGARFGAKAAGKLVSKSADEMVEISAKNPGGYISNARTRLGRIKTGDKSVDKLGDDYIKALERTDPQKYTVSPVETAGKVLGGYGGAVTGSTVAGTAIGGGHAAGRFEADPQSTTPLADRGAAAVGGAVAGGDVGRKLPGRLAGAGRDYLFGRDLPSVGEFIQ